MSKPISPVAIGGFTVGALALLVVGVFIFGGDQLFKKNDIRYVIFFDSSLNGLDIGAPVKMQGVKIGVVKEIALQLDPKSGKVFKPVVIDIDRNNFLGRGGVPFNGTDSREKQLENRDKLVAKGFRARLEMQSLLTGLLYVDFDTHAEKPANYVGLDYQGLIEVPGVLTTTDELRLTAEEFARKLRALPLDQIFADISETLRDIRKLVGSEDTKKSTAALAKALEGVDKTISTLNQNLGPILKSTDKTMQQAHALAEDSRALVTDSRNLVNDVHREVGPVLANADKTLSAATAALNKAQSAVTTVEDSVGPDSSLNQTLIALKDAARSLKDLTDFLERHPESVISGKKQ